MQIKEKDDIIADLKMKISKFEEQRLMYLEHRVKLAKLYDFGIIDSAGEPLIADPPDELNTTKEFYLEVRYNIKINKISFLLNEVIFNYKFFHIFSCQLYPKY